MKKQPSYKLDDDLLRKYLSGDLSADESKNLDEILESDPSSKQYLQQMEKIWNLSGSIREINSIDREGDWSIIRQKLQTAAQPELENPQSRTLPSARTLALRIARIAALFIMVSLAAYMLYYYTGSGAMSKMDRITGLLCSP